MVVSAASDRHSFSGILCDHLELHVQKYIFERPLQEQSSRCVLKDVHVKKWLIGLSCFRTTGVWTSLASKLQREQEALGANIKSHLSEVMQRVCGSFLMKTNNITHWYSHIWNAIAELAQLVLRNPFKWSKTNYNLLWENHMARIPSWLITVLGVRGH